MSDIKFQDYNRIVSQVVAVAMGPDGKPALISADEPAGSVAKKFTTIGGKVTAIEYFSSYNPATETGTLIATRNIRYSGDNVKDIYWT